MTLVDSDCDKMIVRDAMQFASFTSFLKTMTARLIESFQSKYRTTARQKIEQQRQQIPHAFWIFLESFWMTGYRNPATLPECFQNKGEERW